MCVLSFVFVDVSWLAVQYILAAERGREHLIPGKLVMMVLRRKGAVLKISAYLYVSSSLTNYVDPLVQLSGGRRAKRDLKQRQMCTRLRYLC